jgi:hypothetical protein
LATGSPAGSRTVTVVAPWAARHALATRSTLG